MKPPRMLTVVTSRGLRPAFTALALALLAYGGSHLAWHAAMQAREHAAAPLAQAHRREREAETARRSLDLYQSQYAQLRARGVVDGQLRFDWVEAVKTTARRLGLAVRYELSPTQTLEAGEAVATELNPMQLELEFRHEGDLLHFIDAVGRAAPGVLWVRRCELERAPAAHRLRARCHFDWVSLRTKTEGAGT